jgi:hypothetical protein
MSFSAKDWAANLDNPCYRCRKNIRVTKYYCRACCDKTSSEIKATRKARADAGLCLLCGANSALPGKKNCRLCAAKVAAKNHHIPVERYLELISQGCAICGSTNKLAIDHDHTCCPSRTSKCGKCVRAALCYTHNSQVAVFENTDTNSIIRYIEEYGYVSSDET